MLPGIENSRVTKTERAQISELKLRNMVVCFLDASEIIHYRFVPPKHTINETLCCEVFERLLQCIR
jgi:hypothetical protein